MQNYFTATNTGQKDAPSSHPSKEFLRHTQVTVIAVDTEGNPVVDGTETGKVTIAGIPHGSPSVDATKFKEDDLPLATGASAVLEGHFTALSVSPSSIVSHELQVTVTQVS